ncbi:MAG: hypothetical protein QME60_01790 [Verrucomicrobiota bacterium]|nr:hypothetical protein [Verrucomicrobiota bacterium]
MTKSRGATCVLSVLARVLVAWAADSASATATQARSQVELMRMDVERLLMITEALWTITR